MAISPNRIPRKFVEAVQEKKRKENQEKAAKDTKAIRQSFGKDGDKMDYQSSAPARKKVEEKKPQRLVSNQGIPLKFIEETQKAKREEASKPIDEQIKGSVKKKEVKVKSGQDVISDKMSFGKAFRAARNEGMKTFTWRGKKYGTKLKKKEEQNQSAPSAGRYDTPQQTPSKPEQGSSVKASEEQIANRLKRLTEQDRKVGGMITTARRYGRNKQAQRLQERYDLIRERQKKLMGQYKELTGKNFPDPRVNKG